MPAHVGKYNVEAEIGCGALVRVFRGFDGDTGRRVTLKVVTEHADKALVERFRRDVANAAKLRDPSISAVYELSEDAGLPYAAMQCLDGDNLMQVIRARRPMTLLQKSAFMWQVMRGLDILHAAGLSAGIRPSSIVPGPDGTATMQDFGVLRCLPEDEEDHARYRPPEGIAENSPDPLSDVFSFGAVYYELLTHTSFAGEAGRIRDVVPDCPEPLENLVLRALEKRRELRYQSIAELQRDAEPIISDLRRAHAAALLPATRRLIETDELEKAEDALSDILRMEPANRAATRLRAEVRERLRRKTIAARIGSLFDEAEQAASNGQLEAAVELLRSALRFGGVNAETKSRLAAMELRLERARTSAGQVREAQRLFNDHRLTEARAKVLEAIESDPRGHEAPVLLETVVAAIIRREAEAKIQRGVHKAEELLCANKFEQAIGALEVLQSEFPDFPVVAERLHRARIEKRRADLLDNVRRCLENKQFGEAVALLEPWAAEAPGDREVTDLLSIAASSGQRARHAAAQAAEALHEAQLLVENDRVDLAVQLLADKCAEVPGEPELASRLSAVEAMLPGWKERRVIHDVLVRVAALDELREPSVALSIVEEALQAYPASSELAEAAGELRSRVRDQERQKRLDRRWEAIRRRIDAEAWPQALALLETGRAEFPEEPEFETQLAAVQERLRRLECDRIVVEVRQFVADGETEQAGRVLQEALDSFGETPGLATVREELAARKKDDEDLRAAQVLFGRRRFEEAERILARLDGGNRPEVVALLAAVREASAISTEEQFYESGRDKALKLIQQQEFEQAADLLRNLISLFPDDPILSRQLASAEAGIGGKKPAVVVKGTPAPEPPTVPVDRVASSAPPPTGKARVSGVRGRVVVAAGLLLAGGSVALRQFTRTQARGLPPLTASAPSAAPQYDVPVQRLVVNGPSAETLPAEPRPSSGGAARERTVSAPPPRQPTRGFVAPPVAEAHSQRPSPDLPAESHLGAVPGSMPALPANVSAAISVPAAIPAPAPPPVAAAAAPAPKVAEPPAPPTRVGGVAEPPKPLRTPPPRMPELAVQRGMHGDVQLELTVSKEGVVTRVRTISGEPVLAQAAKNAVLDWRYQPARLNGQPIESRALAHITFEGRR